jgi:hypothetical protein
VSPRRAPRPDCPNVSTHGKRLFMYPETHRKLKLLAARWGLTLAETADRVFSAALAADQKEGTPDGNPG